MLPIAMDSIMEPIWRDWNTIKGDSAKRNAFWLNKRSRLLPEAIPMDRKAFHSLVRGWYVADALDRLKFDDSDKQSGLKVTVTTAAGKELSFPHPLLSIGNVKSVDRIAAVVQSSILAMAQCNQTKNLEPLAPYEELIALGSEVRELNSDLARVIIPESATDEGKMANIEQMVDYLQRCKANVNDELAHFDSNTSPYALPLVWEIKDDISSQLDSLIIDVQSFKSARHSDVSKPIFKTND